MTLAVSPRDRETFRGVRVGEGKTDIPVRNLWLLYLYASDLYGYLSAEERIEAERLDGMPLLLAIRVLIEEVNERLKRDVTTAFVERTEVLSAVRDRIRHLETERGGYLRTGRVVCTFEELSRDTPRNRYVLAALKAAQRYLAAARLPSQTNAAALRALARSQALQLTCLGVRERTADPAVPRTEVYGRMDRGDARMVSAAQFVLSGLVASHVSGVTHFQGIVRDERALRKLFESAVRGFYQHEFPHLRPRAKTLRWGSADVDLDPMFPKMTTDISFVLKDGRQIVLDTKFTSALMLASHGTAKKLKPQHLYQLYAYLRTQENPVVAGSLDSRGVLLYPRTDDSGDVDVRANLQGHEVRVLTVDLAGQSNDIARVLRDLVEW